MSRAQTIREIVREIHLRESFGCKLRKKIIPPPDFHESPPIAGCLGAWFSKTTFRPFREHVRRLLRSFAVHSHNVKAVVARFNNAQL